MSCGCNDEPTTQLPGPQGAAGANAFTLSTADFTMPVIGSGTVSVSVEDTSWIAVGQTLFIQVAGYMKVASVDTATSVTAINDGASGNASSGTNIPSGATVSPGGVPGPQATLSQLSPTTTKGDLIVGQGGIPPFNTDVSRFGAGTNGSVLHADSSQTLGLAWRGIDLSGALTTLANQLPIANGGTGQSTQQGALNTLMPSAPVLGDLTKFNGSNWVRFPITVTTGKRQQLRINAAGTDTEWAWQGVLQSFFQTLNTYSTISTGISITADTAPTSSTGTQIFTQAITPSNTTGKIRIRGAILLFTSSSGAVLVICNGATVLATFATGIASTLITFPFDFVFAPGATTALTINLRAATGAAGSVFINGNASNRVFNTTAQSTFEVEECA